MRKTFSLPVAATAAGGGPTPPPPADTVDNIEHSVRLNSADSAQLTKTFSSAGNTETNTISLWVKRNKISYALDTYQSFLSAGNNFIWHFDTADRLGLYQGGFIRYTTQKFRDPSAWYHFVFATDTTQSAASDQIKVYVNGQLITDWDVETALTQNTTLTWNSNVLHNIGSNNNTQYPDIQIADVQSIDGQALTPSSFGFTDSNGVWQPKAYSGSYGTNGFYLDFADTSSATALGNDVSGNNNDFTPSGLVAGPAYTANSFSTEFDGTGDYLSIPSSTDLQFGTGDWTIEHWVYIPSGTSMLSYWRSSVGVSGDSNTVNAASIYFGSGASDSSVISEPAFIGPSNAYRLYSGVDIRGKWTHVAVTKASNTVRLFVDGILKASQSDSNNYNATGNTLIGVSNLSQNNYFLGKISNVRVIKGRALYTAAFTPPSTALTAVTDTVLLTCQDSTFIDNSASAHTITANGDAATTTVSPFEPVDGSDAMLDSPTNYGSGDTVRGNYCTLNPLNNSTTLSNGNLQADAPSNIWYAATGTFHVSSGKWYWEVTPTALGLAQLGVANPNVDTASNASSTDTANSYTYYSFSGNKFGPTSNNTSYGASYAANDVIGVALDMDNGTLTFYKNNVSQGIAYSGLSGENLAPFVGIHDYTGTGTAECNFGQQPFKYPLAGYKSLCSTNLPTPAVADGSTAMDVALYTGTSSALAVSTPNMSPDLVWIKRRNFGWSHRLYDSIRGAGTTTALYPDRTDSEGALNAEDLDSFDSAGFTVGPASPLNGINAVGGTFAAWTWDAGSSTVSNTDGTLTSSVRANPTAGVSIATFTAQSSGSATFGHSLIKTPEFVIIKSRDAAYSWLVWHKSLTSSSYSLILNTTAGESNTLDAWNSTLPTSSVVSLGSAYAGAGNSVAYCFAPVEGFSAFGSFTGSTSNTFVYTGMRPRWLMIKRTDTTGDWQILDTEREGYNVDNDPLWANLTDQEGTTDIADILSNGFKMRDGATGDYIYAAFAEHPFKTSRAR